jgi:ubiquinone biosynthesis protein
VPPVVRHGGLLTRIRNLERIREITEIAAKHGFGYFFERHRLLSLASLRRRRGVPVEASRGRHLREMLDELGPTFVKFGQLLSTRPDIVPPDIVQELVLLQDQVSPLPFATVKEVVEEELGLSLQRAFAHFEEAPLASASIGQVHGALLPGGEPVVVKVQRPGAARQIRRDVELLFQVAEMLEHRVDWGFSLVEVVREFSRSINRELDYVLEARNAERFGHNFAGCEKVVIPRVYANYSTSRLLTLERIAGPTLNATAIRALDPSEKKILAESITDCWFRQILHDGFFHADPHPANIVYLGEGRIGLLDFGTASVLRQEDLQEGVNLFLHVMDSDLAAIKRSLRRLGVHWPPSADEVVTQSIEDGFSRYFGVSLASVDVASLLHQVSDLVYSLHLRLPTRFLLLDKALLTLEGVVRQLYPGLNIFEVARRYTHELRRQRLDPRSWTERAAREAAAYAYLFRDFPVQMHDLLEEMRTGELEIKYRHTGLEEMIHRLDLITNRVVVTLLSIALGATGAAVAILVKSGPHIGGLSVWGVPGFLLSVLFGVWLIYAIIRSGRL